MKFRIGHGGPRQHRHGQYRSGGSHNKFGMSEIDRLIHLIASMQILFGSRRGDWVSPLLLIALAVGRWCVYSQSMPLSTTLEKSHVMYNSSDRAHWLRTDRDTLCRRVILPIHAHDFHINLETIPNYRSIHLSVS